LFLGAANDENRKMIRIIAAASLFAVALASAQGLGQWPAKKANDWYAKQPWLVGANFMPSNAINELEMWQAETWSPELIDKELGWAKGLGMNTMRAFLHDLAYRNDPAGFKKRLDSFLKISAKHGIRPMLVLFDSCWDPYPKPGKQRDPKQGLHNSGWVQSPGREILENHEKWGLLQAYVKDIVSSFRNDQRILAWDVVNEPDNDNANSYGKNNLKQEPADKRALGVKLTKEAFTWVRAAKPSQPVTAGPWNGDWSSLEKMNELNRFLIENSDIVTFHNYDNAAEFEKRVKLLQQFGRPLLCTEYMARVTGSTFQNILPVAKEHRVAAINWGFVSGKSQTIYPWDSWQKPYASEPPVWFHDIFRTNGDAYRPEETAFIKSQTGASR
jgi:hypothetical protein